MDTYTDAQMNAAIRAVEDAKAAHPVGWGFLREVGFEPDPLVLYAFTNAASYIERIEQEDNRALIYATGWLQGIAVGASLP